jgi:hypothetical protein
MTILHAACVGENGGGHKDVARWTRWLRLLLSRQRLRRPGTWPTRVVPFI